MRTPEIQICLRDRGNGGVHIVIPEEREKFMFRKLNSQLLKERVENEGWKLIFFKNLREFYNKNERKRTIDPRDILKIATLPVEEREKQVTIDSFSMSMHALPLIESLVLFLGNIVNICLN